MLPIFDYFFNNFYNLKFSYNSSKSEKMREKFRRLKLKERFILVKKKLFSIFRNKYLIQSPFMIQKPPGYSRFAGSKVHFYSGIERGV